MNIPDYDNMSPDEINHSKMIFRAKFREISTKFPDFMITMPDFETESLITLHCKYEELIKIVGQNNQKQFVRDLICGIESTFPEKEITFDYTTGLLKEIILSQILSIDDSVFNKKTQNVLLKKLKEKISTSENREKIEVMVFGIILWLVTWITITKSSDENLKRNFLESELMTVEIEDVNVSVITTKVIDSPIFNTENGEPYIFTQESTKVVRVISKIIVKNRNILGKMITESTCLLPPELINDP